MTAPTYVLNALAALRRRLKLFRSAWPQYLCDRSELWVDRALGSEVETVSAWLEFNVGVDRAREFREQTASRLLACVREDSPGESYDPEKDDRPPLPSTIENTIRYLDALYRAAGGDPAEDESVAARTLARIEKLLAAKPPEADPESAAAWLGRVVEFIQVDVPDMALDQFLTGARSLLEQCAGEGGVVHLELEPWFRLDDQSSSAFLLLAINAFGGESPKGDLRLCVSDRRELKAKLLGAANPTQAGMTCWRTGDALARLGLLIGSMPEVEAVPPLGATTAPVPATKHVFVDEEDLAILRQLKRHAPRLLNQVEVSEGKDCPSTRSVGKRLAHLIEQGLVIKPSGPKRGATISPAGVELLANMPDNDGSKNAR